MLMLGGIGHFIVVDLSALMMEAGYVHWQPSSLINELKATTVDWGVLGNSNAYLIFSGFSIWVTLSMIILGAYNLLIFSQLPPGHKLRKLSLRMCLVVSFVFLVLAGICFIYAPVIGAALAVLLFGMAVRKESGVK
jgi:hypothetical protein